MCNEETYITDNVISQIESSAKEFFHHSPPTHDWEHTMRVVSLCKKIGYEENADMKILIIAALLHDIGREEADRNNTCHAELSSKLAKPILEEHNLSENSINRISHCILTHRFRGDNQPKTIEAKVLFDSDKLDAIGAIGICRAYSYAGENHQPLYSPFEQESKLTKIINHSEHSPVVEFKVKLSKIMKSLYTDSGRKIATERHNFMANFFTELFEEIKGNK